MITYVRITIELLRVQIDYYIGTIELKSFRKRRTILEHHFLIKGLRERAKYSESYKDTVCN